MSIFEKAFEKADKGCGNDQIDDLLDDSADDLQDIEGPLTGSEAESAHAYMENAAGDGLATVHADTAVEGLPAPGPGKVVQLDLSG